MRHQKCWGITKMYADAKNCLKMDYLNENAPFWNLGFHIERFIFVNLSFIKFCLVLSAAMNDLRAVSQPLIMLSPRTLFETVVSWHYFCFSYILWMGPGRCEEIPSFVFGIEMQNFSYLSASTIHILLKLFHSFKTENCIMQIKLHCLKITATRNTTIWFCSDSCKTSGI